MVTARFGAFVSRLVMYGCDLRQVRRTFDPPASVKACTITSMKRFPNLTVSAFLSGAAKNHPPTVILPFGTTGVAGNTLQWSLLGGCNTNIKGKIARIRTRRKVHHGLGHYVLQGSGSSIGIRFLHGLRCIVESGAHDRHRQLIDKPSWAEGRYFLKYPQCTHRLVVQH
jgi:hypothetical protein